MAYFCPLQMTNQRHRLQKRLWSVIFLSVFLERAPQRKIQREHVCRYFLYPKLKKEEGCAGLQFTFGLFIYMLDTDSPRKSVAPNSHRRPGQPNPPSLPADLATQSPTCQVSGFAYFPIPGSNQTP